MYFLTTKSSDRLQLLMLFIGDAQLRASSGCASPKSFFIGAHGQELSGAKKSTLFSNL
jgi:hypothetical protein